MSGRALAYLADFAGQMATRKYGKVPLGHSFGSQLGVNFNRWEIRPMGVGFKELEMSFLLSFASIVCVCFDYLGQ
jgi:hypothetical protein